MVFDKFHKGTPCVWAVLEKWQDPDVIAFLEAVKKAVNQYRQDHNLDAGGPWAPSCFIIDCAMEERNAIK